MYVNYYQLVITLDIFKELSMLRQNITINEYCEGCIKFACEIDYNHFFFNKLNYFKMINLLMHQRRFEYECIKEE